jgi:hypothetical protein
MTENELHDVLSEHADGLARDEELAGRLLTQHQEQANELAPLFQLASALKGALTPAIPAPAFRKELGQELVKYGPPLVVLGRSVSKRRAWVAVAAAGSLLSLAGVVALLLRRVGRVKEVATQPAAI